MSSFFLRPSRTLIGVHAGAVAVVAVATVATVAVAAAVAVVPVHVRSPDPISAGHVATVPLPDVYGMHSSETRPSETTKSKA
jgi:hypothetical protein